MSVPDGTAPQGWEAIHATSPKQRLLDKLETHVSIHGVGDLSVRGMAAAIGSSHRMLNYHFGSRREILIELSKSVERKQRAAFEEMASDETIAPTDVMRRMHAQVADTSLHSQERLFFELYSISLNSDVPDEGFLPDVVEAWIPSLVILFERLGFQGEAAEAEAHLALAVSRGLLLDLLATNDRKSIDAAMNRYVARYEKSKL